MKFFDQNFSICVTFYIFGLIQHVSQNHIFVRNYDHKFNICVTFCFNELIQHVSENHTFVKSFDHNINICVLFHSNDPIQLVPENCSFFWLCPMDPLTGFKMVAVIHFCMKMPKLPLSLIYLVGFQKFFLIFIFGLI